MPTIWWIVLYVIGTAFLLSIALGRGLKTLVGAAFAEWHLPGSDNEGVFRLTARIALALWTVLFVLGLIYPGLRGWDYAF